MPNRRNPHPDAPPMRIPGLTCDSSTSCRNEGPEAPRAAGSDCQIRFDPMNRCVALRRRTRRVGVGPTRSRFDSRPQGALGSSLSCGDLDGCCLCAKLRGWWRPWPTAKRLAPCRCPHGTALRGERRMGGPDLACDPSDMYAGASAALLRADSQRLQGPGSIVIKNSALQFTSLASL